MLWLGALPVLAAKLPIPRFVSLRSGEVNFRVGPGKQYPTQWTYVRYQLPVKVIKEHENWRYVEDHEGVKGWVHQTLLSGIRTVMIQGSSQVALRKKPDTLAPAIARAEEGVIARLVSLKDNWVEIKIYKDFYWIPRANAWGILVTE